MDIDTKFDWLFDHFKWSVKQFGYEHPMTVGVWQRMIKIAPTEFLQIARAEAKKNGIKFVDLEVENG